MFRGLWHMPLCYCCFSSVLFVCSFFPPFSCVSLPIFFFLGFHFSVLFFSPTPLFPFCPSVFPDLLPHPTHRSFLSSLFSFFTYFSVSGFCLLPTISHVWIALFTQPPFFLLSLPWPLLFLPTNPVHHTLFFSLSWKEDSLSPTHMHIWELTCRAFFKLSADSFHPFSFFF